jgi:hypothetical protein
MKSNLEVRELLILVYYPFELRSNASVLIKYSEPRDEFKCVKNVFCLPLGLLWFLTSLSDLYLKIYMVKVKNSANPKVDTIHHRWNRK